MWPRKLSWLFSEFKNNFVKFVISKLIKNENIYAVDDLYSIPTCANQVAKFLYKDKQIDNIKKNNQIYHFVGSGKTVSWYQFACEILNNYNIYQKSKSKIIPIKSYDFFKNNIRPKFSPLDNSKFSKEFNFKIDNWEKSLNETIKRII